MNAVKAACRELFGLFVEDGALALMILGVVALAGVIAALLPRQPLAAGSVLLFGCLGVLIASLINATAKSRR